MPPAVVTAVNYEMHITHRITTTFSTGSCELGVHVILRYVL